MVFMTRKGIFTILVLLVLCVSMTGNLNTTNTISGHSNKINQLSYARTVTGISLSCTSGTGGCPEPQNTTV